MCFGFGKSVFEKGVFAESPFSRDSREFRDSRDSSSEKTSFVMTPFSGPECFLFFDNFIFRFLFLGQNRPKNQPQNSQ